MPAIITVLATGLYTVYGEDVVRDTASEVTKIMLDSAIAPIESQMNVIHIYLKLQNPELFKQAKELSND